ncbi:twin-arginine translocase subunit TatC [Agrococcus jejuensis]|uniref:Sec-independent protein translocase protein TatC n=1 Tax=Agrococcus jejuensis TaxID=399736 RepID=A0A1G8H634_9MICO|nr:twin-arginine translocase subunit TatC [Agrococcus jejuensis]SDI02124.1 sec-independent protein translocase protein TatC [Agrococcus jejuensis]
MAVTAGAAKRGGANPEGRMRLIEHLRELRRRFVISFAAIAVLGIGGFFVSDFVLELLSAPLTTLQEQGRLVELNITYVTQAFDIKMRIGLLVGLIASSPVWLYHLLAFLLPGLHKGERRYVWGFLLAAVPLFLGGCTMGWFLLPRIIQLFVGFAPDSLTSFLSAQEYFDFSFKLVVAIGLGFVVPVVFVFLNLAGAITGAAILKGWRWAVLGIALFAACVTPAGELLSMFLIAGPIIVLYFGAAGIAVLNDRRRAKRLAADSSVGAA